MTEFTAATPVVADHAVTPGVAETEGLTGAASGGARLTWRRFRHHRLALVGLAGLLAIALLFVIGPLWSDFGITEATGTRRASPSWTHPFGTDEIQRDLFVRTMVGGRYSLLVGVLVALAATGVGTLLGMVAGYFGGWPDVVIGQLINLVLIVPALVALAVFAARFGAGPVGVSLVVAALLWTRIARVVRGIVLAQKSQEFVLAARAAGASSWRIVFRHLLPNVMGPVIVEVTLLIGAAIVLESTLSFLGLGVQPPTPTLGNLVLEAKGYIDDQPRRVLTPGLLIVVIVLCVNFVGDGLRDALDPRTKVDRFR